MCKLNIEYRTKEQDENNYFKGETYFTFIFDNKTTIISIAPDETRKLSEIVYGIEKELQDGYHLNKNEKFEIEPFDKYVMEYEENSENRFNSTTYNFSKKGYQLVQEGKATYDQLIKMLENI